jgi:ATP-binding cassette, subfamily C, type I secretion system permease/ATPase
MFFRAFMRCAPVARQRMRHAVDSVMRWLFASRLRQFVLLACAASVALNLALLIPSIYMLQVFDRVLSSRSNETLAMLSLLAALALVLGYFADSVRAGSLAWAGRSLDRFLSPLALENSLRQAALNAGRSDTDVLRDIGQLRGFLSSGGILALFDAPWLPLYLLIIGMMHPLLGMAALFGALLLVLLAALTERLTRLYVQAATRSGRDAAAHVQALMRAAEAIVGMGMTRAAVAGWQNRHDELLLAQERLNKVSTRLGALARMSRQGLQVAMLGLGAWLVVDARSSPGIMIAATILLGRALQPVEQLISGWKAMIDARAAWARLSERPAPASSAATKLPAPTGGIELNRVVYASSPGPALIKGISLRIEPGESVGIIGRSAAGKTTLVRLLLGILTPQGGAVRLDGADISQWNRDALGEYVGYVPQDVQLVSGTVAQNIARLGGENSQGVVQAAQLAHAHEMIVRMPEGYDTQVGEAAARISGGQRQRIALARALYGNPRLVVLDEPNANLDAEGELALASTLKALKQRGVTVVMVGHRSSLMAQLDKLAVLNEGALEAFGRSEAVLSRAGAVVRQLHRSPSAGAAAAEIQT